MGIIYHEGKLYNSGSVIADNVVSEQTTFSSDKINNSIAGLIKDTVQSVSYVWSSQKVSTFVNALRDKTVTDGTYTYVNSYSSLCNVIAAKVATMEPYTIENMVIACSATFTQMPLGGNFGVQIYKGGTNNYISAILQG